MPHSYHPRRIFSNTIWSFAGYAISTLSALIAAAVLARMLEPSELGLYFLAFSIVSVVSLLSQFGLPKTVVRLLAELHTSQDPVQTGHSKEIFNKCLIMLLASVAFVSIVLYAFGIEFLSSTLFHNADLLTLSASIIWWSATMSIRTLLTESLRGLHDIRGATLLGDMSNRLLFLVFLIGIWSLYSDITIERAIYLNVAALLITSVAAFAAIRPHLKHHAYDISASSIDTQTIIATSAPLLVTNLTNLAYSQTDIWLLGHFTNPHTIAMYGAASRLAILVLTPQLILSAVTAPMISSLHKHGQQAKLQRLIRITTTYSALPSIIAVLLYVSVGDVFLALVYGDVYQDAHLVLAALGIGYCLAVSMGPAALTLMMTGHGKTIMYITTTSAALLIGGGIFIVPAAGAEGMAVWNALVVGGSTVFAMFAARAKTGIWTLVDITAMTPSKLTYILKHIQKT